MILNALSSDTLCASLFSNYPEIIRVAAFVASFTFILIILTLIGIFYHRVKHGKMVRLSTLAEGEIIEELNDHLFLFDSVTDIPEADMNAIVDKLTVLKNKNDVFGQSMADVLIHLQTNLTGSFDNIISSTFSRLKLRKFTLNRLRSSFWFLRTKGLNEVHEMQDGHSLPLVYKLVNDRNPDVRVAAYTVLIKMKTKYCFDFLSNEKEELSEWHLIVLGDAVTATENADIPDFKNYLTGTNKSLIILSVRLIVTYLQFNAIPKVLLMLDNEDEQLRNQIIIALGKLAADNGEERLIEKYDGETDRNKSAILFSLGQIGSGKSLNFIVEKFLEAGDFAIMKSAASAIFAHPGDLKDQILQSLTTVKEDHLAMLRSFN